MPTAPKGVKGKKSPEYVVWERKKYEAICNYIAGMTDRTALDEHKKLFEPYQKV